MTVNNNNDTTTMKRRQQQHCHCSSSNPRITPWWSLLLLTLIILLFQPATAQKTALQGYLYWDINSNGILDQGELNSGVVDMTIQLRDCASSSFSNNNDNNQGGRIIDETISTWHPLTPGEKFEGHNEIYNGGGYYKFDIDTSCLITDGDLLSTTTAAATDADESSAMTRNKGCYLRISSLEGYQITSSFPLRHLNYHERDFTSSSSGGGRASQVFDWIPHYDVMPTDDDSSTFGSSASEKLSSSSSMINHGYQARTQQCFGYHPTKRAWYIFPSSTSTAMQLPTPNEYQYGYDTLIYGRDGNTNEVDVYDTTLSMTPLGLSENGWPLELRVTTDVTTILGSDDEDDSDKTMDNDNNSNGGGHHHNNGGLILGLKLDKDRTTGDYVLLSDLGNLEEGKGKSGTNGEGGGEARFEFVSSKGGGDESVSALTYFSDRGNGSGGGNNVTAIGSIEDDHDNMNGILENPRVMIDVIQSFLLERGNLNTLEEGALELAGLTVVLLNQWSLVRVVDKAQKNPQLQGTAATRDLVVLAGEDGGREEGETARPLRGSLSSMRDNSSKGTRVSSNRLLRGRHHQQHSGSHHRSMIALPEPHIVFEFAVYAKYRERDTPNQDAVALQVSSNFGNIIADTCNSKRETLIARIRGRSGYFQGCNPKTQSSKNENTDGSVTYTAFGGGEKDYVEINIGVVNRFDCDKLLPLYYFELETLAVRPIIDTSGGSLSRQGEVLSKALQLLQVDDGYYNGRGGAPAADNNSSKTTIVVSVSVVMGILFFATVAAVWYVRRERRKLREERETRRKAREAKLAAKEARKQRKHERSLKKEANGKKERVAPVTVDKEESIPVKVDDAPSLSNDHGGEKKAPKNEGIKHESYVDSDADSELGRLFDSPEPDLNSREEKDARPTREPRRRKKKVEGGGSESDSDQLNASSRSQRRKQRTRRRRKKKVDGGSETDSKTTDHSASNISGMNNTTSSKDERQSTDKTPATRSQSSHHESDPHSSKADADEDLEPPTRIEVSGRGTLQKGISDISLGLAASLKKSFTRAAATLKDLQDLKEDDPAVTLKDLQEDDPGSKQEDRPREKKKEAKSTEHKNADTSRKDKKGELTRTRSRRRTLTKAMSSFRKSSTAINADVGEESGRRRRSRPAISKVMSSFRKPANENEETNTSERKAPTRMLSQVRMSVRNLVIGGLSSSSDDDSSSDSDSNSDSDSSSSSNNSADMKRKRHTRKAVSRRTTSESKSRKEKESDTENSRQRRPSRHGRGEKRASLDKKMKPKESEEMSKTNDYLPHNLDANFHNGSGAVVALSGSEFTRVDDSSCAAVATMKPPSERSLGSKTKSSKSNSDSNRADAGSKRNRRDKSDSHGHRERRKKDKSSRHHSSSKKSHKKKDEEGKGDTVRKLESFKRSLSLSNSITGTKLSESAKSALESEEDAKDSKKKSKHSSKRKSSRKHRHREESDRGAHRDPNHREDDSERGEKDAERNGERRKRQSRRKYSDEFSDRETDRGASHKGRTHKSSPHRTKTKLPSSKHTSHKKSSGNGERSSRRRTGENAN